MALETTTRRRKRLSMTSLIDVIFLLLLFFMLTSTFTRYGEIEVATAGQSGSAGTTPPIFLSLKPDAVLLNGVPVALDRLHDAVIAATVETPRKVLISFSEGTTSQELADLLSLLRGIPDTRAMVLR